MKLLTFLAKRFAWSPHAHTLEPDSERPSESAADPPPGGDVAQAVVVFLHAEAGDERAEAATRAERQVAKHVKWLAGKRGLRRAVLHSFTHLAADSAPPEFAREFLGRVAARLERVGFEVSQTPFGWVCEWELAVHGESLAKVWKEV